MLYLQYFVILGGVIAGSLAIVSDAAHLLTDFASFMVSLLALLLASRPPTRKMSFGWYRAGKFYFFPCPVENVLFRYMYIHTCSGPLSFEGYLSLT